MVSHWPALALNIGMRDILSMLELYGLRTKKWIGFQRSGVRKHAVRFATPDSIPLEASSCYLVVGWVPGMP